MSVTIQERRDTAANWTAANPVLHSGEFGVETDTSKLKLGDGATTWTALAYWGGGGTSGLPQIAGSAATVGPSQFITPVNFATWRAALARVRSGTGSAKIMCVGDSTTSGDWISNVNLTWPTQFTGLLNSYLAPAAQTWGGWHGTQATGADTRITVGTGWTLGTSITINYWSSGTSGAILSYAPSSAANGPASVDSCTIWYIQNSGHGGFTVNVDGGSTLATVNSGSPVTAIVTSVTVTFTAGASHTINVVPTGVGGSVYILGFDAFLSTANTIRVYNPAIGGSRAADWANTSVDYYPGNWPALIVPDLVIIDLGINDAAAQTLAQYTANMQIVISNCLATGASVLLKSFVPSELSSGLVPVETTYVAALPALAAANGCGYLDGWDRWVSYLVSNAYGYYVPGNTLHPNGVGCADIAQAVFEVISRV